MDARINLTAGIGLVSGSAGVIGFYFGSQRISLRFPQVPHIRLITQVSTGVFMVAGVAVAGSVINADLRRTAENAAAATTTQTTAVITELIAAQENRSLAEAAANRAQIEQINTAHAAQIQSINTAHNSQRAGLISLFRGFVESLNFANTGQRTITSRNNDRLFSNIATGENPVSAQTNTVRTLVSNYEQEQANQTPVQRFAISVGRTVDRIMGTADANNQTTSSTERVSSDDTQVPVVPVDSVKPKNNNIKGG